MSDYSETIANAGNVEVPCFLALKSLGYALTHTEGDGDSEWWIAIGNDCRFVASDPVELLGIIAMRRERGPNWMASDDEIDGYVASYYPEQPSSP